MLSARERTLRRLDAASLAVGWAVASAGELASVRPPHAFDVG